MGILDKVKFAFRRETVETPAPAAPAAAPPAAPSERRAGVRHNAREGTRVLIIDDSPTVVFAFKKILKSVGCVTIEAGDAELGLELARSERPELIFLDIVLPGMNGFAALRQIRRDPALRDIPVIMISSNEQATEQFFGSKIGADDFMKKPFGRIEVFARIGRMLDADNIPRRMILTPAPGPAPQPDAAASNAVAGAPQAGAPAGDAALVAAKQETASARAAAEKSALEAAELRNRIAALENSLAQSGKR
ncbi:response regulator [Massilia glaciei]|uniref:response regulator n=1 Tax=Massilia glaciei TaxID=1524097 RepID=UPI001E45AEEE|nr:response regulator [Massilia glaciei]